MAVAIVDHRWFALFVGFLIACRLDAAEPVPPASTNAPIPVVTVEDLRALMVADKSLTVADARSREAYDDCHIPGAISAPEHQVADIARDWPRDRRIVVYCRDPQCQSSREAARTLLAMGFTRVTNCEGGILEWRAKGFETTGPAKMVE